MMHVAWGSHNGGARNCHDGEYDTCRYFLLIVGLPVYLSFEGCFHVIDASKVRSAQRREKLREFVQTFLGLPDLARRITLPLRPRRDLKGMWFYSHLLAFLAALNIPGIACLIMSLIDFHPIISYVCGAIALGSLLAVIPYLFLRRPSRRQAQIRRIVAARLGPFSDPAEWSLELVSCVTPAFGILVPGYETLIQTAEQLLAEGHPEDALIVARMAHTRLTSRCDRALADRAEEITEDCLHLSGQG